MLIFYQSFLDVKINENVENSFYLFEESLKDVLFFLIFLFLSKNRKGELKPSNMVYYGCNLSKGLGVSVDTNCYSSSADGW